MTGAIITPLTPGREAKVELDSGAVWYARAAEGGGWLHGPGEVKLGPFSDMQTAAEFVVRYGE